MGNGQNKLDRAVGYFAPPTQHRQLSALVFQYATLRSSSAVSNVAAKQFDSYDLVLDKARRALAGAPIESSRTEFYEYIERLTSGVFALRQIVGQEEVEVLSEGSCNHFVLAQAHC